VLVVVIAPSVAVAAAKNGLARILTSVSRRRSFDLHLTVDIRPVSAIRVSEEPTIIV